MAEKPMGISIVICDRVITEAGTGNKTLVSTFNSIAALGFPVRHDRLAVYVALTNCEGSKKVDLRLTRDGNPIFGASAPVEFPTPIAVVELIFDLTNVIFTHPGLHCFEVSADDEFIFESRFNVVQCQ